MPLHLAQPHTTQMVPSLPLYSLFLGFGGSLVGPGHVHGPVLDFQFAKF